MIMSQKNKLLQKALLSSIALCLLLFSRFSFAGSQYLSEYIFSEHRQSIVQKVKQDSLGHTAELIHDIHTFIQLAEDTLDKSKLTGEVDEEFRHAYYYALKKRVHYDLALHKLELSLSRSRLGKICNTLGNPHGCSLEEVRLARSRIVRQHLENRKIDPDNAIYGTISNSRRFESIPWEERITLEYQLNQLSNYIIAGDELLSRSILRRYPLLKRVQINLPISNDTDPFEGNIFSFLVSIHGQDLLKNKSRIKALYSMIDEGVLIYDISVEEVYNVPLYSTKALADLLSSDNCNNLFDEDLLGYGDEMAVKHSHASSIKEAERVQKSRTYLIERLLFKKNQPENMQCRQNAAFILVNNSAGDNAIKDVLLEGLSIAHLNSAISSSIKKIINIFGLDRLLLHQDQSGNNFLHTLAKSGKVRSWKLLSYETGLQLESTLTNNIFFYFLNYITEAFFPKKKMAAYNYMRVRTLYTLALETENNDGHTPLELALIEDHVDIADEIQAAGAELEPNKRDKSGNTLLHYAVSNHNIQLIQQLLAEGFRLDIRNNNHESTLNIAALSGNDDLVDFLLQQRVDNRTVRPEDFFALPGKTGSLPSRLNDADLLNSLKYKKIATLFHHYSVASQLHQNVIVDLAHQLTQEQHPKSALELLVNSPELLCAFYEHSQYHFIQSALCQYSEEIQSTASDLEQMTGRVSTITSLLQAEGIEPWQILKDDPFGFSPLHLASLLIRRPGGAVLFNELVSLGVGDFPVDESGKTVAHHLIKTNHSTALFRLLIHSNNGYKLQAHYYDLFRQALLLANKEVVAVLQLFWLSIYEHNQIGDLSLMAVARQSLTQIAESLDQFDWVRQYGGFGDKLSSLDSKLRQSAYIEYINKKLIHSVNFSFHDSLIKVTYIDGTSAFFDSEQAIDTYYTHEDSDFLIKPSSHDFTSMFTLLMDGANPNEQPPESLLIPYAGRSFAQVLFLIDWDEVDVERRFALSFLFGSDIKEQMLHQIISASKGLRGVSKTMQMEQTYREALINPDKTRFSEQTETLQTLASELLTELGLKGKLSHVHPVCSCLTLTPNDQLPLSEKESVSNSESSKVSDSEGQPRFRPWCQQKASLPGEHFLNELRAVCNDYGYIDLS